jgi:hypothetical protein
MVYTESTIIPQLTAGNYLPGYPARPVVLELSIVSIVLAMIEQQKETIRPLRREPLTQIPHSGSTRISFPWDEDKFE